MSFLTPLFLLGALAIAAPIVFHLIRRPLRQRPPLPVNYNPYQPIPGA